MTLFGKYVEVVDLISLALLVIFLIRGVWKGFVWQMAGLVSLIGGMVAANKLSPKVAPKLHENFAIFREHDNADVITSYFLIFVAVMLVVLVLARALKGLIDRLRLNSYDRLLGGLFGGLKAVAVIVLVISVLTMFESTLVNDHIAKAYTGKVADFAVKKSGPLFPEEIKQRVRSTMEVITGHPVEPAVNQPATTSPAKPAAPRER